MIFSLQQDGYFTVFLPAEQILFYKKNLIFLSKNEDMAKSKVWNFQSKNYLFSKKWFFTPTRQVLSYFWPAEQIIFYKKNWFISQRMKIWQNSRCATFRAKIIYLIKSDFSLPQDGYFIVFLPAEQILFNKKFWFIIRKIDLLQNLVYRIFRAKMAL